MEETKNWTDRIRKAKTQTYRLFAVLCTAAVIGTAVPAVSMTAYAAETIYAKTTDALNLRTGAGTNYSVIKVLDKNVTLTVTDRLSSGWAKVKLSDGTTGYCSENYLDVTTDAKTTDALNLRTGAGTNYSVIKTIPSGTKVDVLKFSGSDWAQVKLSDGTTGYVCTDYLTFTASNVNTSVTSTAFGISAASKKMAVGQTFQLKATGNQGTVTWTSSDTKIAKVDSSGKVTALAAGTAVITATDSKTKKAVKCNITAVKTEYTKITLSSTARTLTVGESFQLTATTNTDSKNVKFKSSNTNVAKVDANGKVTSVSAGTATIQAYDATGVITASCKVTVNNQDAISLSSTNVTVNAGSSVVVTAYKSNSSMQVKWTSSNDKVAGVCNGRISGLSAGTAVITVSDSTGKVSAKCTVKVNAVSKGNVSVSRSSVSTTAGKTVYIKGYNGKTWGTSDSDVATVKNGLIETKNPGKAAITYTDANGNKAICVVSVSEAAPVKFAYSSPNSATLNQTVTLTAITDKTVSDVYFIVKMNGKNLKVTATQKTAEGNTYVWRGAFITSQVGTFQAVAYGKRNNQWKTCNDAVTDVYVTSKTQHSQTGLEKLRASDAVIRFIGEKEGFVSGVTYDKLANNLPTIAHGYVVWEGEQFYNNLTRTEGFALLVKAVNEGVYTSRVNQMLSENSVRFNQQQFDSLVSFSYNLGTGWTYSSTLKNILLNCYGTVSNGSNSTATVTADGGLYLRDQPNTSGKTLALLKQGEKVTLVSSNQYNGSWYQVKTGSGLTGYCSGNYLSFGSGSTTTGRDLNYVNKNLFINEMLSYHHASGTCYYGLLYRRVDEVEMFLYGDYTSDGSKNKYGFPSPSCLHF